MRTTLSLAFAVFANVSLLAASEAVECLSVRDVRTDLPGLKVQQFLPSADVSMCAQNPPEFEYVPDLRCLRWLPSPATDAEGSIYFVTGDAGLSLPPRTNVIWRTRTDGKKEKVAHITAQEVLPGLWAKPAIAGFLIDTLHGFLYFVLNCECIPSQPKQECVFNSTSEVGRISGLPAFQSRHRSKDE